MDMTGKVLIATLAAFALLGTAAADAAARKPKRDKGARPPAPVAVPDAAPSRRGEGAHRADPSFPANRPPWARATECYTDEGYGRFTPCSTSRDNF